VSPALRLAAGLLAIVSALHGAAAVRQVTIAAAPVERAAMVVTLTLPREFADGAILRDERGQTVPLQAEADLTAKFIVARQPANQTLRFTLEPGHTPDQGNVQVVEEPSPPRPGNTPGIATSAGASLIQSKTGRLRVSVGGRPILYYQMDRDAVPREEIDPKLRRAGYLHPVLTPLGRAVTEDYPAADPTQHGIMTVWRDLPYQGRNLDFGDPEHHPERIAFGGIDRTWNGPVNGGFAAWHRWVESDDPGAPEYINESWELTAYAVPSELKGLNIFDLVVTQSRPAGELIGYSIDERGGLAVRTPANWSREGNKWFRTYSSATPSSSIVNGFDFSTGPKEDPGMLINGSRGVGGLFYLANSPTGDGSAGVAVFYPKEVAIFYIWRLLNRDPRYREEFSGGLWERGSDRPLVFRQRIVVFDGPPDRALLLTIESGYTIPAAVTIAPAGR
jgi:hypothetical protein